MRRALGLGLSALVAGVVLAPLACTVGTDCDFGLCAAFTPRAGDGGAGVPAVEGGVPTDACIDKRTDPSCLDDATALFVAPSGDAGGDGTKARPLPTLTLALAKVTPSRRRVYVCEGRYAEDVTFGKVHDGVSVLGGVSCRWEPKAGAKPVFGASERPFRAIATSGLALVDVEIVAKDAAEGSSVALFVNGGDVTLSGVDLRAGKGANGGPGTLEPLTFPASTELDAPPIAGGMPGKGGTYACPNGTPNGPKLVTTGGDGGQAGFQGKPGTPGPDNTPQFAACSTTPNGLGLTGKTGDRGSDGPSATTSGDLTTGGWIPSAGEMGLTGQPGQGGSGGTGAQGVGGGGGAGACGGAGGGGGRGGGASVALMALSATVVVTGSTLRASVAGSGGSGARGQDGSLEFGRGAFGSCTGGNGGVGGPGGAGGGGAGGVSAAILSKGGEVRQPTGAKNLLEVGTPGAPGFDGLGTKPAKAGVAELELKL